jgi:hypothetical protein
MSQIDTSNKLRVHVYTIIDNKIGLILDLCRTRTNAYNAESMASKHHDKNVAVTINHESETISAFSVYGYDVVNRNFSFIEASREVPAETPLRTWPRIPPSVLLTTLPLNPWLGGRLWVL